MQIFEDYSSLLLFGLRHPSALALFEQQAMEMLFRDLTSVHGPDAFAQSFVDFLHNSNQLNVLGKINALVLGQYEDSNESPLE